MGLQQGILLAEHSPFLFEIGLRPAGCVIFQLPAQFFCLLVKFFIFGFCSGTVHGGLGVIIVSLFEDLLEPVHIGLGRSILSKNGLGRMMNRAAHRARLAFLKAGCQDTGLRPQEEIRCVRIGAVCLIPGGSEFFETPAFLFPIPACIIRLGLLFLNLRKSVDQVLQVLALSLYLR